MGTGDLGWLHYLFATLIQVAFDAQNSQPSLVRSFSNNPIS